MDCRRVLLPAFWLLTGALGCAHNSGGPQTPLAATSESTPPPLVSASAYHPDKKEKELPKRQPTPALCVAAGNYAVAEAAAERKGSARQEQLRDTARKAYQQALTLDAKNLPAYQALGRLYVEMEDYTHAVATYQKALTVQPKAAALWFDLGMCQARWQVWGEAITNLSRAVELEPENRQFVNMLGFTQARAGQYQASLATFGRVANEAVANYQLARMLHHLKQDDLSRQCVEVALQKDPKLEPAQRLLAELGSTAIRPVGFTEGDSGPGENGAAAPPQELPRAMVDSQPASQPVLDNVLPPPAMKWHSQPGQQ